MDDTGFGAKGHDKCTLQAQFIARVKQQNSPEDEVAAATYLRDWGNFNSNFLIAKHKVCFVIQLAIKASQTAFSSLLGCSRKEKTPAVMGPALPRAAEGQALGLHPLKARSVCPPHTHLCLILKENQRPFSFLSNVY